MYAIVRHRRYNTKRGGSLGSFLKQGVRGLAGKAHQWLKDTKAISTRAKAHDNGMVRAMGHAAEHFGYGRCRRIAVRSHRRKVCQRKKKQYVKARKTISRPAGATMAY